MRVFVKDVAKGDTYVIPCSDTAAKIETLKKEVIGRLQQAEVVPSEYRLCLGSSKALLCDKDVVGDVLQDGDFINLIRECLK